tara:strand:- start:1175 stop:1582 length:408 start_codon:yes stop_codon:yes gene_type:complete
VTNSFKYNLKIYYEDTDAGGVVYYANYLKFFERARSEAIYELGFSNVGLKKEFGILIIVKSCKIKYVKPAVLEDKLTVLTKINEITKTSFIINQNIKKSEELVASADIHLVIVNSDGKPTKIPEKLKNKLVEYIN